ncbi:MAG: alpha/beta hydrolase [Alphaproteobacteria bacterium]|nr:alpha/beta hydrolase [Alphaproteobacteria bacterium]
MTRTAVEEQEFQYNPRVTTPQVLEFLDRAVAWSREARGRLGGRLDVPYGSRPLERLDIFPTARANAPVHVFIHGGYWRTLDKSHYSYLAEPLTAAGALAVLINYDLCPAVTVPDIVRQARRAIAWVHAHAADYGGDPGRLTISGHSAGAHLAALALAQGGDGLPAGMIQGAVLISGVYDTEAVRQTPSVQADVRLTEASARAASPYQYPLHTSAPIHVAVGAGESPEWIRMSADYAAFARQSGAPTTNEVVAGHHHFSITELLADRASPLTRSLLGQLGLA